MAKEPVKRQKAMFGTVKGSAGAMTHSGFNTNPVAETRAGLGLGIGGGNSTEAKASVPTAPEQKSNPRDFLDPVQEMPYDGPSGAPDVKVKPKWPSRLRVLEMSVAEFGRLTGTPARTIKGWASGENETHGWVEPMISLLELNPANILALRAVRKKE